ncbi:hypothetical protein DFP72DRAFT_860127, partial [Ephemerocybe angulata]
MPATKSYTSGDLSKRTSPMAEESISGTATEGDAGYIHNKTHSASTQDPPVVHKRPTRIRYKTEKAKAAEDYPSSSEDERLLAPLQSDPSGKRKSSSRSRPAGTHPASLVRTLGSPVRLQLPSAAVRDLTHSSYKQAVVDGSSDGEGNASRHESDLDSVQDEEGSLVNFIDDRAEDSLSVASDDGLPASPPPPSNSNKLKRKPNSRLSDASAFSNDAHPSRPAKKPKHAQSTNIARAPTNHNQASDGVIVISDDDWTVVGRSGKPASRQRYRRTGVSTSRVASSAKVFAFAPIIKRESLTPELPNFGSTSATSRPRSNRHSKRPSSRTGTSRHTTKRPAATQPVQDASKSGRQSRASHRASGTRQASTAAPPVVVGDTSREGSTERYAEAPKAAKAHKPRASQQPTDRPSTPDHWSVSPERGSVEETSKQVESDRKGKKASRVVAAPASSTPAPSVCSDGDAGNDTQLGLRDVGCGVKYDGLPVLMDVELLPLYSQETVPEDTALMPSDILKVYAKHSNEEHVTKLLRRLIEMPSHKVFINASRAPPHLVQSSAYQTSVYLVIPKTVYSAKSGKLPYNTCFFTTGVCAYSNLSEGAAKTFGDRTTQDHRIGLYPIEFEYQRMFTYIGHVAKRKTVRFSYTSGVLAFTTKVEGSNEVSTNYGPSPSKS